MDRIVRRLAWSVGVLTLLAAALPAPAQRMTPDARRELAPGGRVRAALNYSNTLLVTASAPEHVGVAPDLARELARRLGADVEFVGYANAGLAADAAASGAWDVAFIGAEPERAGEITFSRAYVEIEATYLVPASSSIRTPADIDRPGVRVATPARAAYTLFLQRTLQHAQLVEADGLPATTDLFAKTGLEALAGLRPRLAEDAARLSGMRVLDGRFTTIQQAMGVPRPRAAAAAYVAAFVDEVTTSGLVASLIERHGVRGLSVAVGR